MPGEVLTGNHLRSIEIEHPALLLYWFLPCFWLGFVEMSGFTLSLCMCWSSHLDPFCAVGCFVYFEPVTQGQVRWGNQDSANALLGGVVVMSWQDGHV